MKNLILALGMCLMSQSNSMAGDLDPQQVLNEAQALTSSGKYEEALQKLVWYFDNAVRISPSQSAVRLSFALSYWIKLGEVYPKARETLVAIRDKDVEAFKEGHGTSDLFRDVASINGYLDESPKTIVLFKTIDAEKPKLALQCYFFAEKTLAEAGEYTLCSKYTPDASQQFRSTISGYKLLLEIENPRPKDSEIPATAAPTFVENTRQLVRILIGANRKADAELIRKQAIAVLDDPAIRSSIEDAEKTQKPR